MHSESLQSEQESVVGISTPRSAIRVAIVEDMQLFADVLRHLCRDNWEMDVVAIASTGAQAYADIVRIKPSVVLLDLGLPDIDGVTLAAKINEALPSTRIIVVSGTWTDYLIHRLSTVNFHGFVDKFAESLIGLRRAIELVVQGGTYFSPRYLLSSRRLRSAETFLFMRLSVREQEILLWIAQALTDEEIAIQLNLAPTTAQTHRREIMRKLDLHTTPKLVRYGMELGLCIVETHHGVTSIRTHEPSRLS